MNILIATPCYGGQCYSQYVYGLIPTMMHLTSQGHNVELHMQTGESLISRGRNTCAMYALERGFDKLFFIDADMSFTWEQAKMLLDSDKQIIGGTYPLKTYPITINFNPLPDQYDLYGEKRQLDNYLEWCAKYADEKGEAEVGHIPTGFMLLDVQVLADLTFKVPEYILFEGDTGKKKRYFDLFPVRVKDRQYESEDWAFCSIARENGFKVYLQTKAVTAHIGAHYYSLGNHEIVQGQTPLIPNKSSLDKIAGPNILNKS